MLHTSHVFCLPAVFYHQAVLPATLVAAGLADTALVSFLPIAAK